MDFEDWTPVLSGRESERRYKTEVRVLDSQRAREKVRRTARMKPAARRKAESEEIKIRNLPFRKERTELVALSPSAGSRELKKKAGDIEMARLLRDGNLLIKDAEQKRKV